ncbi:ATP-binding protein [uncultured Sphingomonas sp.]|uniref:ATP-binding protein n=1 Tax=uncultured Sphingomonas sp. TaxID=158754 RepID=UPI00374867B3
MFDLSPAAEHPNAALDTPVIGWLLGIAGSSGRIVLDREAVAALAGHADPVLASAGQVAMPVKIKRDDRWIIGSIRSLSLDPSSDAAAIATEIDLMGEGMRHAETGDLYGFRRGVTSFPMPGATIHAITNAELAGIHGNRNIATIRVGTVHPARSVPATLAVDALLGRHFAMLGSTGTGKSTATAMILHRICELAPLGHIVMIDPHGEYANAFRGEGEIHDVGNLRMPYWLMNFEEHCEILLSASPAERQNDADVLAKCLLAARMRSRAAADLPRVTVDTPIPYLLSDLTSLLTAEMSKLERAGDIAPYLRIKSKIEEMKGDPRYAFMFSGMLVADTMASFLGRILRMPGDGRPISIVDVSGVPSDVTSVVVAMLARMIFDHAIWSPPADRRPVLMVCEEAHRYIPAKAEQDSAVGRILSRIAKEGRKYGVSLGLVTQRPSDLAEGVLSQCGTIIAMRLNNERDQAMVRSAMPEGGRGLLDVISALRNREAVLCGEGVMFPMRASFDNLEEDKRPASNDMKITALWARAARGQDVLNDTVSRWRMAGK